MYNETSYETLVLSGNSVDGIAMLGALQLIHEKIVPLHTFKKFVATSSGSMISLLLIVGYSPLEIFHAIYTRKLLEKISFNLKRFFEDQSFSDFGPIKRSVELLIEEKISFIPTLSELEKITGKKLICPTFNLTESKTEYLSAETHPSLSAVDAISMSCAIPFIFSPYQVDAKRFVDGGIFDNFPIKFAEKNSSSCLGVVLKPKTTDVFPEKIWELWNAFQQANYHVSEKKTSLVIEIKDITSLSFFCKRQEIIEFFDKGYKLCQKELLSFV